jgi:hypothetical protein
MLQDLTLVEDPMNAWSKGRWNTRPAGHLKNRQDLPRRRIPPDEWFNASFIGAVRRGSTVPAEVPLCGASTAELVSRG